MLRLSRRGMITLLSFAIPVPRNEWKLCRAFSSQLCEPLESQKLQQKSEDTDTNMLADRSKPVTVQVGGYKFYGVSIAAVETCICIPSLSLAFDAGKAPNGAIPMRYMAITHGHCDHVHGLPLHVATRSLQKLPPATYFVPAQIEKDVRNLVNAVGRLEGSSLDPDLVPLTPRCPPIELKKGWLLKPFRTNHTVPSLGYVVYKRKKKLKKQFIGTPGSELARMRKEGVDLDDIIKIPEIACTGDTRLSAIAESEDCKKARILVTEMTFLDDKYSPQEVSSFGHIHIREVIEKQHVFSENEHVIFTHFSARYSHKDILEAISRLPSPLREKSFAFGVSEDLL